MQIHYVGRGQETEFPVYFLEHFQEFVPMTLYGPTAIYV